MAEFNPEEEKWIVFKEKLELYVQEIGCSSEQTKKAIILRTIGTSPYNLLHSLCSPSSPATKSFQELCDILETHYTPPTIKYQERRTFYCAVRGEAESVSDWYAKVKRLAIKCKFGETLDAFVLDKFVIGLPEKIFSRLCEETDDLTLANAFKKALILETKYAAKKHAESDDLGVNYLKGQHKGKHRKSACGSSGSGQHSNNNYSSKTACSHCGWKTHTSDFCKYKSSKCNLCGKIGHLASVCFSKKKDKASRDKNRVIFLSDSEETVSSCSINNSFDFSIYSIQNNGTSETYALSVEVDGKQLEIICDTGAPCTLILHSLYTQLRPRDSLRECRVPYVDSMVIESIYVVSTMQKLHFEVQPKISV